MAAIDMSAQLREWVASAINDACMGEDFAFDVRWDTQGQTLAYTVIVTMPNPMLGQGPLLDRFSAPVSLLREDAIRGGVHQLMQQLRGLRKQLLEAPKPKRAAEHN